MKRTFHSIAISTLLLAPAWALAAVNINTADATTLAAELEGVGPAKAEAIVSYRDANGGFKSPEDLLKVEGIGERTLEMNADSILVE